MEGLKTYTGLLIAVVPIIARVFGYEVSADFASDGGVVLNDLISAIGIGIATYGRVVTKGKTLFVKKK
jgi:hypothetical protein